MTIINLTSPGKTPAKGDWLEETYGSGRKFNYIYDPELEAEHQYTIHGNTWKGIA